MREEPNVDRDELTGCLRNEFGLKPGALEFLPVGLDTNAAVYRVECDDGEYLLRTKASSLFYPASCVLPGYLRDRGIECVVAPLRSRSGDLWVLAGEWTLILYPFLHGSTGWAAMTDAHWQRAGAIFRQIHGVALPEAGIEGLRSERFEPAPYRHAVEDAESLLLCATGAGGSSLGGLSAAWEQHRAEIHAMLASMDRLAVVLRSQAMPYVICHADLHPGNLLRDDGGEVHVIDWDDVMLAPKERDFIFVGEPGSPFFRGYGEATIDWAALTYYRYERVVTDLIANADDVLSRDDLSEAMKADAVWRFKEGLEGRNFKAARAAASHLPQELSL